MRKSYLRKFTADQTIESATTDTKLLQNNLTRLQKTANHPDDPAEKKREKYHILFVALFLGLLFTSMCLFVLPTSAAGYHVAHRTTDTTTNRVHSALASTSHTEVFQSLGVPWYCYFGPLSLAGKKCRSAPECSFTGLIGAAFDPRCKQGSTGDGNPWSFPCSDNIVPSSTINGDDWLSGNPRWIWIKDSTTYLDQDILNGDTHPVTVDMTTGLLYTADVVTGKPTNGSPAQWRSPDWASGHFFLTFASDTYDLSSVQKLFPIMEGVGFTMLTPVIILIGYQMLWGSWTFSYARTLSLFPQLLLSVLAIIASFTLITLLIDLENAANSAILVLHDQFPFPPMTIDGQNVPWIPTGDTSDSLRGIIMPVGRWGCQANEFVGLLESKFVSDILGAALPFFGGLVKLAGAIKDGVELLHMLGDLILCVMSITLFVQVLFRIILLNYYILISPLVFACWALPGGVGQGVVKQWFKGFLLLLLVQTFQVFVVVTLPLILPSFPQIPQDGTGILKELFLELPPIIVMAAVNKIPSVMGTKATSAIAQAGTVAAGAVTAVAAMAWQTV